MEALRATRRSVGTRRLPWPWLPGGAFSQLMNIPEDLSWEKARFRGQPTSFQHSLVYVLGDCLEHLKRHRDATSPKTSHHNVQLILLACAFFESALSKGLVNAAEHRLAQIPRTAENEPLRRKIAECIAALFKGDIYGDPFAKKNNSYAAAFHLVLGVPPDHAGVHGTVEAVRCLFQLRNMVIHGQTVAATGVFPLNFNDPIGNYQTAPTKKTTELETHLRARNLLQPMTLKGGIGFPFINDAVVDHFLRALVEFFRALQAAIGDKNLCHEFGGGLPQNIFIFLE